MISIYTCNINRIQKNQYKLLQQLTKKRIEVFFSYKRESDQLRCLAVGLLLDAILGKKSEDTFLYNSYGKPFLPQGGYFNLSHAGEYAVLAVSDSLIGVDIEEHVIFDYTSIAEMAFHPDELEIISHANDKAHTFYGLWTLKESYIKYLGTGFSLDPSSFSISLTRAEAFLKKAPKDTMPVLPANYSFQNEPPIGVNFLRFTCYPNYSLSICSQKKQEITSIEEITF